VSDTLIDHPLVRGYLRTLDAACAGLPAAKARELHEQLAAHLEEALPSDAGQDEIIAELDRLGPPHAIAADAAGPGPQPALRKLRNRLGRVRWWTWVVTAVVVAVLGTGAGFLVSMNTAAPLIASGAIGWLYPADQAAATEASADDITQTTVPYRYGQRQGILVTLVNESDWSQEIVGVPGDWGFGSQPGETKVSVQSSNFNEFGFGLSGKVAYASPGVIPPGASRDVLLSWTSDVCMGGGGIIIDQVVLQVRVGPVTRTETVHLSRAFELAAPAHSTCH
jgi:hypothetical protein